MSETTDERSANSSDAPARSKSRLWLELMFVCVGVAVVVAFLLPLRRNAGPAALRNTCSVNLKNIALALQTYEHKYRALPPAYTVDADGKPLHSWRTLILPFLDQRPLYESIDLSKPWDVPANAAAYNAKTPEIFLCPAAGCPENHTTYLAVVTPTSCLRPGKPRPIADIRDGLKNTIVVLEVAPKHAVHWMAPSDADEAIVLALGPNSELAHDGGVNVAFCDGRVIFVHDTLPKEKWQAAISIAGSDDATDEDF